MKLLPINSCNHCPSMGYNSSYCGTREYFCTHSELNNVKVPREYQTSWNYPIIKNIYEFPVWCPLEDSK